MPLNVQEMLPGLLQMAIQRQFQEEAARAEWERNLPYKQQDFEYKNYLMESDRRKMEAEKRAAERKAEQATGTAGAYSSLLGMPEAKDALASAFEQDNATGRALAEQLRNQQMGRLLEQEAMLKGMASGEEAIDPSILEDVAIPSDMPSGAVSRGATAKRARDLLAEFDSQRKGITRQLTGRYGDLMSSRMGDKAYATWAGFAKGEGEYTFEDALKSYTFDRETGSLVSDNPMISKFGLNPVYKVDAFKALKPKKDEELFMDHYVGIEADPQAAIKALSFAKNEEQRALVLRRSGQFMEANPQLQKQYPDLWAEYSKIKAADAAQNKDFKTITYANADGTTKVEEWLFDKGTGKGRKIKTWVGSQAMYPVQLRGRAAEKLPEIQEGLTKVENAWMNLTPKGQSMWGKSQRWGERLWAKLQTADYDPSKDSEAKAVYEFASGQVALSIAKIQSGAQRSDQEIERIQNAYLNNELSYWEAKIQLKMLKDELLRQEESMFNILEQKKFERYRPKVDFDRTPPGGAVTTPRAQSVIDKFKGR